MANAGPNTNGSQVGKLFLDVFLFFLPFLVSFRLYVCSSSLPLLLAHG
jgi:hypothetical protein